MNSFTEYSVFWLDDKQNDPLNAYKTDRSRLRGIIDYLQLFSHIETCVENIRSKVDQQIFIIVTSSCWLSLFNQTQNFSHVRSIYTYQDSADDSSVSNASDSHAQHVCEEVSLLRFSVNFRHVIFIIFISWLTRLLRNQI